MERDRRSARRVLLWLFVSAIMLYLIAPILIIVPVSFNGTASLDWPPRGFSLQWFTNVLTSRDYSPAFAVSVATAFGTAVLSTILGTLAAIAIVRGRLPGRQVIAAMLAAPAIVPLVVVAIGVFSVYGRWGLMGNPIGIVIAHTGIALPFVVVAVSAGLLTMPPDLEVAARSLGASPTRAFRFVTFPLILPSMLAGALLAFVTSWDEVVIALFLTSPTFRTLPVAVWQGIRDSTDPRVAAVATILIVATVLGLGLTLLARRSDAA